MVLFEDRFVVRGIDNSKYEHVSRITAKSTGFDAEIVLDVNSDLFPVRENTTLHILLTNTLGGADSINTGEIADFGSLVGDYEYAMYGKIFRFEEISSERRCLYTSFGGLLMSLTADKQVISDLELDMRIYLLAQRIDYRG